MSIRDPRLENTGLFDKFYIPHLDYINKQAEECIKKYADVGIDRDAVLNDVMVQSKIALIEISYKTLINDFHETVLLSNKEKTSYESYESRLNLQEEQERILGTYPVLKFLLDNRISAIIQSVIEVISRYAKDKNEICKSLCIKVGLLKGISISCGDPHNHGKGVTILNFSDENKVVYKPRSLAIDLAFEEITQWLYEKGISKRIKCAKSYNCGEYGWQEYIETKCCVNNNEINNYCLRIGLLLAIFRCLGTSDMHAENIVPCGEYPVIIDLETLVTNHNVDTSDGSIINVLKETYAKSVLGTCLLPNRNSYMNMDIDISGLGASGGQKSSKMKYHVVENKGTSEIKIVEKYVETTTKDNSLMLKDKKINYLEYLDVINKGFSMAYNIIVHNKSEFQKLLDTCLNKVNFRQVLRGTFVYEKFLKASYHPSYLRDFSERKRVLSLIIKNDTERENSEVNQMIEDDIPYFYSKYNDNHLWYDNRVCQENYFLNTTCDEISKNLSSLGKNDLNNQVRLINNSFIASKEDINVGNKEIKDKYVFRSIQEFEMIKDIMDFLYQKAIWNHKRDKCVLIDIDLSEKSPFINVETEGLYSAVGTIIFTFLAAKEIGEKKYIKFSRALLEGYEEIYEIETSDILTSVFSGFTAKVYLYFFLYQLTGEDCYFDKYNMCIKKLYMYNGYDNEISKDVIGGLAGCVIMLSNIYQIEKSEELKACIAKYTKSLYTYTKEEKTMWTGFAHGLSGFALAFFKSGKILDSKEYCIHSLQLIEKENEYYLSEQNNWRDLRSEEKSAEWFWCHGAPGILMTRAYMLDLTEEVEERSMIEKFFYDSIDSFKNNIELNNQSLCHGTLGNVTIAKFLAKKIEDKKLGEYADAVYKETIAKMTKDGVTYGIPGVIGLSSFMLGISGIGYAILMHMNDQYPNLLGMELKKG